MSDLDTRTRNRILLLLFLGVLMGALDIAIVGPALPAIQADFNIGERALTWIFTTYVLFNLIGTPLMAKLSDAFGRRSIYVIDVSIFALGSLIVALSPSFTVLLTGRALQGLGSGGIFPVASAVIGDTFPPEKRGSALGLIGAVFGLAFLIGPVLGGVLLLAGWPWLFLINLPLAALVIGFSLRILPATRPNRRLPFDWAGMIVLGTLLAALTYALNQLDTANLGRSLSSLNVWPFLLIALSFPILLWRIEQAAADPILRLSLFRSRQVIVTSALAFGAGLGEAAVVFIPALLVLAYSVKNATASFMLLPVVLAMAVGSPLAGRLLDRIGSRIVIFTGMLVTSAGMLILSFLATTLTMYYLAAGLIGFGLGFLLGAPLRYIMLNEAPARDRAAAQGILTLFTSVGQLVGGALVGAIVASQGGGIPGYQRAYLAVGLVVGLLILLTLRLKRRAAELATVRKPLPESLHG